jgi:transcriptional regulator with XRE-family HTH domain
MGADSTSSSMAFFADELKRLRAKTGMTQEQLASELHFQVDQIKSLENCRRRPSPEFAEAADRLFGTDEHFARLQKLVEDTWVLPWFRDLVEVEQNAGVIRLYEPYQIPALFQIESYTRAMAQAERPMLSVEDVGRAVELRTMRQQILREEHAPQVWAVIEESVLHRVVGGSGVMQAQFSHLACLAMKPNITIQIVENSHGGTCAFGRAFIILTVKPGSSLVYLEDISSARYLRRRDEVSRYMLVFDYLRAAALDDARSIDLIRETQKNDDSVA